ncbi:MAG TPA: GFA family protein [Candidatus Paceibacterota bacterium]|nr:GFA family protein [Candidatus Paceibacterota bacterium]
MRTYTGGCHCGAVRFTVELDLEQTVVCNCSHCGKKGFILSATPKEKFTLEQGEEVLTDYFFNKKAIRHPFCSVCGVQAFSEGITYPGMMVNVRCLDGVDTDTLSPSHYNGKDV